MGRHYMLVWRLVSQDVVDDDTRDQLASFDPASSGLEVDGT